jgi:DNA-binding XRE family transcriptional regulator
MTPEDLKSWRKAHGYSQAALARALGVIPLTVTRWEMGVRKIPPFLAITLYGLECKGGEKKPRETKTGKEVTGHGKHLPKR